MTALETCRGCGERRLLFEPERLCLDCRDRSGAQLAIEDLDGMSGTADIAKPAVRPS
jgi:hypothetical protein